MRVIIRYLSESVQDLVLARSARSIRPQRTDAPAGWGRPAQGDERDAVEGPRVRLESEEREELPCAPETVSVRRAAHHLGFRQVNIR